MSKIAIRTENISKAYQLGEFSTGTISRDIERWWANVRGKEDPFLRIGETNDRTSKGTSDIVWSLKDINFDIQQGDAVGIIGRNGAGKSTLLKVLSRVTSPTSGCVKVKGRVASLLEVGTGFHPELTGKENIFLNGAILGMRKAEIKKHFDAIVEFAGVERYIDTPVKRYSSGMYVRLAFAVAAHLESEILIVDEVLAVGDAEFQRKCLGKMSEVSKGEGRTVLFVSHNMGSVKTLCQSGILLKHGQVHYSGKIQDVINEYVDDGLSKSTSLEWGQDGPGNENIKLRSFKIYPSKGSELNIESGINIELSFINYREKINLAVSVYFLTADNVLLFESPLIISQNYDSLAGTYTVTGKVPPYLLNAGYYKLNLLFGENQKYVLFDYSDLISFELEETFFDRGTNLEKVPGLLRPRCEWKKEYNHEIF